MSDALSIPVTPFAAAMQTALHNCKGSMSDSGNTLTRVGRSASPRRRNRSKRSKSDPRSASVSLSRSSSVGQGNERQLEGSANNPAGSPEDEQAGMVLNNTDGGVGGDGVRTCSENGGHVAALAEQVKFHAHDRASWNKTCQRGPQVVVLAGDQCGLGHMEEEDGRILVFPTAKPAPLSHPISCVTDCLFSCQLSVSPDMCSSQSSLEEMSPAAGPVPHSIQPLDFAHVSCPLLGVHNI